MKEMVYKDANTCELLEKGNYKGYDYYVINMGTHPCCYVDINGTDTLIETNALAVHGGVTYIKDCLWTGDETVDGNFIGWDYMHLGDFHYFKWGTYYRGSNGKKYTTPELVEDCKKAIDEIEVLSKDLKTLTKDEFATMFILNDSTEWYQEVFTCVKCNKDFMAEYSREYRDVMFCPFCGRKATMRKDIREEVYEY